MPTKTDSKRSSVPDTRFKLAVLPVISRRSVRDDVFNAFVLRVDLEVQDICKQIADMAARLLDTEHASGELSVRIGELMNRQTSDVARIYDDMEMMRGVLGSSGAAGAVSLPPLKRDFDPAILAELQQTVASNTSQLDQQRNKLKHITDENNRHIGEVQGRLKSADERLKDLASQLMAIGGDIVSRRCSLDKTPLPTQLAK